MESKSVPTRSKKGVVYSKVTGDILDCLFCRIARGQSPENQLWYQDDKCAVFIPRGPAARLHLLVVPLQHIQTVATLNGEHSELLEHMQKVALEQLRVHSQHIGSAQSPLHGLAPPPTAYPFNRGHLPNLCPSLTYTYHNEETPRDSSFVFCFHRPPYNSIDHLHLHAIQKPYRTLWNHFMFAEIFPWHGSYGHIFQKLVLPNMPAASSSKD